MTYPEPILAQLQHNASSNTLSIVMVGFLFVMLVLALLSAITATLGAFFIRQAAREARSAAEAAAQAAAEALALAGTLKTATPTAPTPTEQAAATAEDPTDPQLAAVIAAAVHTVFGDRPHRIISIRQGVAGWAQEGRRQIFSSHSVR